MAIQDVYNSAPGKGFPGMVVNGETSNRISRTVEDAAGIAFGMAAFRGGGDHGITGTPTAGTAGGAFVDTVGANIALPGWVFDETVASGGIVRIARR